MSRKDERIFRRKFLTALARQQKWTAGDALDFQTDLQIYEQLIRRNSASRRTRKSFEVANHPFVDRCAFLLDSSFMEKARFAASRALGDLEDLAAHLIASAAAIQRCIQARIGVMFLLSLRHRASYKMAS